MSSETRTRNETGRLVSSQIVKRRRAERLAGEVQQPTGVQLPRFRLIGEDLDVGDVRVGDHDAADLAAKLEKLGLPLDQTDFRFGVFHQLDEIRDVLRDVILRSGLPHERWPIRPESGVIGRKIDDPRLRASLLAAVPEP